MAKHHPKPPAQVTASHRLPKLIYDAEDPNSHPNQIHAASNPESETELEFSEKEQYMPCKNNQEMMVDIDNMQFKSPFKRRVEIENF